MKRILLAAIGSLVALGLLTGYLALSQKRTPVVADAKPEQPGQVEPQAVPRRAELLVYAAASQKIPLERIVRQYEAEFPGRTVQLDFGASQEHLAKMELAQSGDLYIPADDSYLMIAQENGFLADTIPVAEMRPLLVVARGNPLGIESLFGIMQKNARFAQANPDAAAIGKRVRESLSATGMWDRLAAHTTVFTGTVVEAANALKLGTVDATIVWDGMLPAYPEFEVVPAPELAAITAQVGVGVLTLSENRDAALHFARYMAARDKGVAVYRDAGFRVLEGAAWSDE